MAIFPHLDFESKVQINDKTRLDASKSFVSKGSAAITTMTVKPGNDASAISVFDSSVLDRVLDWEFKDFTFDIDATNNKIDFSEGSGSALVATITTASYTLAALATEIATQMTAAGTGTYTGSILSGDLLKISSTIAFNLLIETGDNIDVSPITDLGFFLRLSESENKYAGKTEYTGHMVRAVVKKITLTVNNATTPVVEDSYLRIFSVKGDCLFSDDSDLLEHESEIIRCVPKGRNTFKHVHRLAQSEIIKYLDEKGFANVFANPFILEDLKRKEEFQRWSKFMALRMIYEDLVKKPDDIFSIKKIKYLAEEIEARGRAVIRVDVNEDSKIDTYEQIGFSSARFVRR